MNTTELIYMNCSLLELYGVVFIHYSVTCSIFILVIVESESLNPLQNIISAMRVLLDARQKLGYVWANPERQKNVDSVMR